MEWVMVVGFHTESGLRNVFVTVLFLRNPDKIEKQFFRRWLFLLYKTNVRNVEVLPTIRDGRLTKQK